MGQISRYPISNKVYERCWDIFNKTLIGIHNKKDAQIIISDLLTPTERIMIVKRMAVAFLLTQGYQYREISKILRVSLPTISTVNLAVKYGKGGYNKAISRILKDEKLASMFNNIAKTLVSAGAMGGKGSGGWRSLKRELENVELNKPF